MSKIAPTYLQGWTVVRISLLATGGTISTRQGLAGAIPGLDASTIARSAQVGDQDIQVCTRDVLQVSSRNVTPMTMWDLARTVREEIDAGAAGIIITHGTDTLEETAYALSLLVQTPVPLVLTGAMRVPGSAGEDGPANVAAAFAVATNPVFSAYGPLVVHQDEIHLARWVTKVHSARVAAFASPSTGPVGIVVEGRAIPLAGPLIPENLSRISAPDKRVELIFALAGSDGLIVDAIRDQVDGIVLAALGGGHVASALAQSIVSAAARGVAVVLASRCPSPQVLRGTYGGIGSETHLLESGLVSAGNLAPIKARLRLIFGLSAGFSPEELFAGDLY